MKKVLIITYYWPPSGGGGVQRWLKFSKYLPENGWEPIVYVPENPDYPSIDESLLKEISPELKMIKTPIWEPYRLYKFFTSNSSTGLISEKGKISLSEKISRWIRGNCFMPDARRFWIKPSIKYLTAYLKENPVDAIVSTGPPHSMHAIGLGLVKRTNIPWVADFRDPMTTIDFIGALMLTKYSMKRLDRLESVILKKASMVTVAWDLMQEEFSKKIPFDKVHVVYNGYDRSDFKTGIKDLDQKFSISHLGSFSSARNLPILWKVLGDLTKGNAEFQKSFRLKVAGQIDPYVLADIKKNDLESNLDNIGYIPHERVTDFMTSSHILLLAASDSSTAKGMVPGKLFEYLMSNRPILAVGPKDSTVAKILSRVNADPLIGFDEETIMRDRVLKYFNHYKQGIYSVNYRGVENYDRKFLAKKYSLLMDSIFLKK